VYDQPLSESNHPEACDTTTYYLEYHIWAAITNIGVTAILSIVFSLLGMGNTMESLKMPHVDEKFGIDHGESEIVFLLLFFSFLQ
jgi:hypothetical protein